MKPGTVIKLPDGRIGTICYRHLDGEGGVWGVHDFGMIFENFNDEWPEPDFILRSPDEWPDGGKRYREDWKRRNGDEPPELVGTEFEVVS